MIANYTTAVPVKRSVAEVQDMLAEAGASHVAVSYDGGQPVGLLFELGGRGYQLPARVPGVLRVLQRSKGLRPGQQTEDHARRVSWRILRDWTRAQLATIQADVVSAEEVFLPWLITDRVDGRISTLYQDWAGAAGAKQLEA